MRNSKKLRDYILLLFLCIFLALETYNFTIDYKIKELVDNEAHKTTNGIVTGYSNGARWVSYSVEWIDHLGRKHFTGNRNPIGNNPNIGDTIQVIFDENNPKFSVINSDTEISKSFKNSIIVISINISLILVLVIIKITRGYILK